MFQRSHKEFVQLCDAIWVYRFAQRHRSLASKANYELSVFSEAGQLGIGGVKKAAAKRGSVDWPQVPVSVDEEAVTVLCKACNFEDSSHETARAFRARLD